MKLVSGRKYKNDLSDIVGIVNEINKERSISLNEIEKAVIDLYGNMDEVDPYAYILLKDCIEKNMINYDELTKMENKNKENLLDFEGDIRFLSDENIEYLLEKMK